MLGDWLRVAFLVTLVVCGVVAWPRKRPPAVLRRPVHYQHDTTRSHPDGTFVVSSVVTP